MILFLSMFVFFVVVMMVSLYRWLVFFGEIFRLVFVDYRVSSVLDGV